MLIKKCLLALVLSSTVLCVCAQDEEEEPKKGFDKDKLFFGGSFGASFGSYTFVNVSPLVGYQFNRFFAAGAGINFIYSSTKYDYYVPSFKDEYGVAGLNIFGRVYPIPVLFAQVQPEMNYTWGKRKYNDGGPDDKLDPKFVPSLLLGAGAAIPLGSGGKGAMTVMLQYDAIQDVRSPYGPNAFFSVGFNF